MYKLVFSTHDGFVFRIIETETVVIDGEKITWDSGSSQGINSEFVVVPYDTPVEPGTVFGDDLRLADIKDSFIKVDLKAENQKLKDEIAALKAQQVQQDDSITFLFENSTI